MTRPHANQTASFVISALVRVLRILGSRATPAPGSLAALGTTTPAAAVAAATALAAAATAAGLVMVEPDLHAMNL